MKFTLLSVAGALAAIAQVSAVTVNITIKKTNKN
jgi:hypothetical protein